MFRKPSKIEEVDLAQIISSHPDEKLIEILKKRDYYRREAVKLAIEEAIKRGIIFSEQDLFAEEYKVKKLNLSILPEITKSENKQAIRKSIARSLVLVGIIPLVLGLSPLKTQPFTECAHLIIFALLWMYSSAQLVRSYQNIFVNTLFILTIGAFVYSVFQLVHKNTSGFMDYFILSAISSLIIYGLLFIKQVSEPKK